MELAELWWPKQKGAERDSVIQSICLLHPCAASVVSSGEALRMTKSLHETRGEHQHAADAGQC